MPGVRHIARAQRGDRGVPSLGQDSHKSPVRADGQWRASAQTTRLWHYSDASGLVASDGRESPGDFGIRKLQQNRTCSSPADISVEVDGAYGDPARIDAVAKRYGVSPDCVVPVPGTSSANIVAYLEELKKKERTGWAQLGRCLNGQGKPQPSLFDPPHYDDPTDDEPVLVKLKDIRLQRLRDFGDVWLALGLWRLLGLDPAVRKPAESGRSGYPAEVGRLGAGRRDAVRGGGCGPSGPPGRGQKVRGPGGP